MKPRDIKDFVYASLTFTGVLSLYTLPMIAVLASPDREPITSIQPVSPHRVAVFHLSEPEPVEAVAEVAEENINLDNTDHNIDPEPESEIINLSAGEPSSIPEPSPVVTEAPPEQPRTQRRRRRNRYRNCQDNEGIEVTGSGYNVSRDVVDSYAHITRYRRLGHVSWYESDTGERSGFRLRRINCDLREAGIRNGDVVTSVNGHAVLSIPEAIRMWFKVRRKSRVVLEIIRRGEPMTINYELT